MKNEQTDNPKSGNGAIKLRDEYCERSAAIVQQAKDNNRELNFMEVKMLNELSRTIVNLSKTIKPTDEVDTWEFIPPTRLSMEEIEKIWGSKPHQ